MDKRSEKLFKDNKDSILDSGASFFNTTKDRLKKLGSFESIVYEFERDGKEYILKITHDIHRSKNQILGELDWTNYLSDNGVRVPHAFPSINDNFVEPIGVNGSEFFIYVQEKAQGCHITEDDWGNDLFYKWGRITGKMHRLTKAYKPSDPAIVRPSWFDDGFFQWENANPENDCEAEVLNVCREYIRKYKSYQNDSDSYGLIHTDLHYGNYFLHEGDIIAFDFDDSRYDWFAHDIAIPLIYSHLSLKFGFKDNDDIIDFFKQFMEGYNKENSVNDYWLSQIPVFLKTRELDLYFILKDEGNEELNEWCRSFLKDRYEKIVNDEPFIDLDFTKI